MIELTNDERNLANYIAHYRNRNMREMRVPDYQYHVRGVEGEMAFCKMFNVYYDITAGARPHDCYIGKRSIDVKTTNIENGRLQLQDTHAIVRVDAYALMIGDFGSYEFKGFAKREALLKPDNLLKSVKGRVYALPQSKLSKIMPADLRVTYERP